MGKPVELLRLPEEASRARRKIGLPERGSLRVLVPHRRRKELACPNWEPTGEIATGRADGFLLVAMAAGRNCIPRGLTTYLR